MRSNSASMCSGANYFISSDGGTTGSGTACWRRSKPRLMPAVRSYGWCASTGQSSKPDRDAEVEHPPDETLGRSRSGRTTKLHLACDGRGRVLAAVLTPGQRHESTQLGPVLDAIRVPRRGGRGRPRKRPDHVIADQGYIYPTCLRLLRRRSIPYTFPEWRDQRRWRAAQPGARSLSTQRAIRRGTSSSDRWVA
ncbi:MAG: transposase [Thermomicrobiales bacterium]